MSSFLGDLSCALQRVNAEHTDTIHSCLQRSSYRQIFCSFPMLIFSVLRTKDSTSPLVVSIKWPYFSFPAFGTYNNTQFCLVLFSFSGSRNVRMTAVNWWSFFIASRLLERNFLLIFNENSYYYTHIYRGGQVTKRDSQRNSTIFRKQNFFSYGFNLIQQREKDCFCPNIKHIDQMWKIS